MILLLMPRRAVVCVVSLARGTQASDIKVYHMACACKPTLERAMHGDTGVGRAGKPRGGGTVSIPNVGLHVQIPRTGSIPNVGLHVQVPRTGGET